MQHDFEMIDSVPGVPDRPAGAHKGSFGSVIVIGGSETMFGAPALCARAAFRCGAGLVKIATPQIALGPAITIEPSATGICLTGDTSEDMAQLQAANAHDKAIVAIGPGMGQLPEAQNLIKAILAKPWSLVIDADGLNHLAKLNITDLGGEDERGQSIPRILTPHPGEFARLAQMFDIQHSATDLAQRPFAATALAREMNAIVVLKGQDTIVADGRRVYTNLTGNPALATAGTGDVLTGAIASFLAQGLLPFDAASLAVYLHGSAGDAWAAIHGPSGLRAMDLADHLPVALHHHRTSGL